MHKPDVTLAFALFNCDIGTEKTVIGEMRGISGVSEASGVSGIYDIIAKLHAESNGGIMGIVRRFHRVSHVKSCSTMIVAEGHEVWPSR